MNRADLENLIDEEMVRRRKPHDALMIPVTVRACDRKGKKQVCRTARARAKIDTGATNTLLPHKLVQQLRPKKVGQQTLYGINPGGRRSNVYGGVSLDFGKHQVSLAKGGTSDYPRKEVDYVLLGRRAMAGGDDKRDAMKLEYDGATGSFSLKPVKKAKAAKRGRR